MLSPPLKVRWWVMTVVTNHRSGMEHILHPTGGGGSSSVSRKVPNGFYPLIPGENIFNTDMQASWMHFPPQ